MAENNAAAIQMSEAAAARTRRKEELMEELLELSRQDAKEEFEAERNKIEKRKAAMIRRKEDLLESSRQDAKQEFEAGRKTIMDRVPDQYKNRFGEVSFAKWGMRIRPVLIVSPYDVPMGPDSPREQWLGMFERLTQEGRIGSMTYLIYWYGAKTPADYYSFIPKSSFITELHKRYKGLIQRYEAARDRVDTSEKAAQEMDRKYKEMREDLVKSLEERKHGGFQEGYLFGVDDVKRQDAKEEFEAGRKRVMDRVPDEYKNIFGQVGFGKWENSILPVLIVNPYDVPMGPGSPREQWLGMFEWLTQQGRIEDMTYLAYWYGAKTPADYYSFIPKSAFIPESDQQYKSLIQKHETAQASEKVPVADQEMARKYKEMQEDLLKPREERKHVGHQEGYELLSMSDVDEHFSDNDESEDWYEDIGYSNEASEEEGRFDTKAKASKTASSNKKKAKKVDQTEVRYDEDDQSGFSVEREEEGRREKELESKPQEMREGLESGRRASEEEIKEKTRRTSF